MNPTIPLIMMVLAFAGPEGRNQGEAREITSSGLVPGEGRSTENGTRGSRTSSQWDGWDIWAGH